MQELNKYFTSVTKEVWRSAITPSPYNPRVIDKEARGNLKRGVKQYGVIGGMVWNERTGNLVSGHQKLSILDELNKYDKDHDYLLKVEAIDVDDKTEKELNIFFNSPSAQGEWDYERLRELLPDIDYKNAGLTDEDLNLIGIDFTLQTETEKEIAGDFDTLLQPVREEKEEKRAAIKEKKAKALSGADEKAQDLNAYVTVSFETFKAKASFMQRFGFDKNEKFIRGEFFEQMIERID